MSCPWNRYRAVPAQAISSMPQAPAIGPARPRPRIVSLVPSITETLFDLGLDEAVSAAPPSVSARAAG